MKSVEETNLVSRRKMGDLSIRNINGQKVDINDFYGNPFNIKKDVKKSESDVKTLSKPETKTETKTEAKTEVSVKTLRNRKKKAKMKERKRTQFDSWTKVQTKEVKWANLRFPDEYDSSVSSGTNSDPNHMCVILKNLPNDVKQRDLKRFFKICGTVTHIDIIPKKGKKSIAFITFQSKNGSDKALSLSGFWYEGQKVYIEYSKPQGSKRFAPQNIQSEI